MKNGFSIFAYYGGYLYYVQSQKQQKEEKKNHRKWPIALLGICDELLVCFWLLKFRINFKDI